MLYALNPNIELIDGEEPFEASVRYRTVGDMTCTGAVRSTATTLETVVSEIAATRITERGETRADDRVTEAAMEDRKREGYFWDDPRRRHKRTHDTHPHLRPAPDRHRRLGRRWQVDPHRAPAP